jgi:hypothetical protein
MHGKGYVRLSKANQMTKGLETFFDLPPLDEILKDQGIDVHTQKPEATPEPTVENEEAIQKAVTALHDLTARMEMLEGTDHAEGMDELYKEILTHARDLMAYGFNIEQTRARGVFEIASLMYGHAISAKNSKRDAQLKAMKLALDRRKVDLEEKRTNHAVGQGQAATIDNDGTIVIEDRNELIKRLREQMKKTDS